MEKVNRRYTPGPGKKALGQRSWEAEWRIENMVFFFWFKARSSMRHSPQDTPAEILLRVDWRAWPDGSLVLHFHMKFINQLEIKPGENYVRWFRREYDIIMTWITWVFLRFLRFILAPRMALSLTNKVTRPITASKSSHLSAMKCPLSEFVSTKMMWRTTKRRTGPWIGEGCESTVLLYF